VALLTAPRALLVQQCAKDRLFPTIGMKESVEKIAAVYKKAGVQEKFAGRTYAEPHQFTRAMQFTSESEAPLEPFVWDNGRTLTKKRLLEQAGAEEGTAVEETLADFFRAVPAEDKAKFDKLAQVLKDQLSGVKVYKVGDDAEKQVVVVGKTSDGQWAGLKTSVVGT
jgi:hypothetical protein